jgi:hypothetical protein
LRPRRIHVAQSQRRTCVSSAAGRKPS